MASTNNLESIQDWPTGAAHSGDSGARGAGLGQIGDYLMRAAREESDADSAADALRSQWRNATPVP